MKSKKKLRRDIAKRIYMNPTLACLWKLEVTIVGEEMVRHMLLTHTTVTHLQQAVRQNKVEEYETFAKLVNEQNKKLMTLRGLFEFSSFDPIPLDQVEPWTAIVKRFKTGGHVFRLY